MNGGKIRISSTRAMDRIEMLKKRLTELDNAISETEKRLPAHSIKPPVMHDLLDLEDERDRVLQEIAQSTSGSSRSETPDGE